MAIQEGFVDVKLSEGDRYQGPQYHRHSPSKTLGKIVEEVTSGYVGSQCIQIPIHKNTKAAEAAAEIDEWEREWERTMDKMELMRQERDGERAKVETMEKEIANKRETMSRELEREKERLSEESLRERRRLEAEWKERQCELKEQYARDQEVAEQMNQKQLKDMEQLQSAMDREANLGNECRKLPCEGPRK